MNDKYFELPNEDQAYQDTLLINILSASDSPFTPAEILEKWVNGMSQVIDLVQHRMHEDRSFTKAELNAQDCRVLSILYELKCEADAMRLFALFPGLHSVEDDNNMVKIDKDTFFNLHNATKVIIGNYRRLLREADSTTYAPTENRIKFVLGEFNKLDQ